MDELWWGYLHVNETIQAKRYFGPEDLKEAHESQFVAKVVGPFPAEDREDALHIVKRLTS
jgi:hypothetical protein